MKSTSENFNMKVDLEKVVIVKRWMQKPLEESIK